MHELSLCRSLIATMERQLASMPEHAGRRVRVLKVNVGALSGCEPDLLAHLFPHASPGTRAEGAELEIEFQPAVVACDDCGCRHAVGANQLCCPACGSPRVALVAGDGVFLTGMSLCADPLNATELAHVQ
ncbi:MAG: hydrogenase maturation nickel metallochaperone HypA [Uliginosibacterium sp.]|jgi:hydrogenase nickel incorporation protein HypA/HybF|nr:hydrogenase maturation nickel metallochaperone HypA [Uliginosibacterium sp.]MBK9616114.1 hydrogenase maturation nickel metallochaperone HypA [Uliginosibacterium sp.]